MGTAMENLRKYLQANESPAEEKAEKKLSKPAYAKNEKMEGAKSTSAPAKKAVKRDVKK